MRSFLFGLVLILSPYIVCSFTNLEIDPTNWPSNNRLLVSMLTFGFTLFCLFPLDDSKYNEDDS